MPNTKFFSYCLNISNHEPFPKRQIFDSFKLKDFADVNSKFNENGREFSRRIENTAGKRKIACYEQFLLFHQCFQKTCTADTQKPGLVWKRVNRQIPLLEHFLNWSSLKFVTW